MKTIILGLDGTSSNYLKELIDSGVLPTFKMLSEEGCFGNLKSTIPADSSTAWSVSFTGKNSGKTGIYGHLKKMQNYAWSHVNCSDLQCKPIWEIVSEQGKKCFLFSMPETHPPSKVNGIMISEGIGMSINSCTYPANVTQKLIKAHNFAIRNSSELIKFEDFKNEIEKRFEIAFKIIKENDFDLVMIGFKETDVANHLFYFERQGELHDLYKIIDINLEKLLSEIPEPFNLIIYSDHGFKGYEHLFHLGSWMAKNNLMKLKTGVKKSVVVNEKKKLEKEKLLAKHNSLVGKVFAGVVYEMIFFAKNKIPFFRRIRKFIPFVLPAKLTIHEELFPESLIDFEQTEFYPYPQAHGNFAGIYVNLKGREINGVVAEKDFERKRNEFIGKIKEIKFPGLNKRIVKNIWKKEELFQGDLKDFPDIFIETQEEFFPSVLELNLDVLNIFRKNVVTPQHESNGLIMAFGSGVKQGSLKESKIISIAPTILASLNLPIPNDFEEKELSIFSNEFLKQNPIRRSNQNSINHSKTTVGKKKPLTKEQEDEIKKELKRLGYM